MSAGVAGWLGPDGWQALLLSLRVSFWATLASLPLGVVVAMLLARTRFPGRQLLNGLVHLPLILPPVVTGYLLLLGFGRRGPIGAVLEEWFGVVLAFRWTGAALAAAVMAFPLMVRAIRLSVEAVDPRLEQAGATLGASRPWVFATVTLPLIAPGIVVGAILAFAKAMGEFGATITFVANIPGETQTLPTAVYVFLQVPCGEPMAMRLVLVSVAVAMLALLLSEFVSTRVARRVRGA
jgi:molybdate transport system permease protein